jgi:hypothetical protein
MFIDKYSYHSSIRNAVIAFGTLFKNIYIRRTDAVGSVAQTIAVPLSYGPKQKFIQRIHEAPQIDKGRATFEVILPHMGFEMTGLEYDPSRKLPVMQQTFTPRTDGSIASTYVSTPYDLHISLSAWAKNQADGLQIVEQILPYFNPDLSIPVNDLPELNIQRDIQIILNSVTLTDDYAGNYEQRIALLWEFDFTMKINLYGFVAPITQIKTAFANVYTAEDGTTGDKITVTTNPSDATIDSQFDYVVQFEDIG